MNGKGDKSRVRDLKSYRENFAAIDWGGGRKRLEEFTKHLIALAREYPPATKQRIEEIFAKRPWTKEELR